MSHLSLPDDTPERHHIGRGPDEYVLIEDDRYLVIDNGKHTNTVDLRKLSHFYVASNGAKSELILVEQEGRPPIRIAAKPHQLIAMRSLVRHLRAIAPAADRTNLRHAAAMRRLRVANRPIRWLLFAPLIGIAAGLLAGSSELRAALDRGHTTADMSQLTADWDPDSRNVTIHNVRLLDDIWSIKGEDDRFWAAVVKRDWKVGDPVFMFASAKETSQLAAVAASGTLDGVLFKDGDTALPDNDQAIRAKLTVHDHPITIETPSPSRTALLERAVLPAIVFAVIALLIALFRYHKWGAANSFVRKP